MITYKEEEKEQILKIKMKKSRENINLATENKHPKCFREKFIVLRDQVPDSVSKTNISNLS